MQTDDVSLARKRAYRDKRYKKLDQRIIHGLESRIINHQLDRVCPAAPTILDMPVGYGRFLGDLRRRGGLVVGSDHKPAMLQLSRETHGGDLPVTLNDCGALPFADNSFDVVVCIRLFQHLHDPDLRRRTFTELGRVTRGHAVITTYLENPLHQWFHRRRKLKRLTYHSTESLEADMAAAGLRLVAGQRSLPGLHAQYIMLLEKTASVDG